MKAEGKNSRKLAYLSTCSFFGVICIGNLLAYLLDVGGLGYVTENCVIDATHARSILADLKERKDLVQMTFENNTIVDQKGMCEVFKALKGFEKLESLNFR